MAVKKIGELLVESGLITQEQLEEALQYGRENKGYRLGGILVKKGYATEMDIAQTLAFQLDIQFVDMASATVDPEALKLIEERLAKRYLLIPLYREKKVLTVAMSDPLNLNAIDDLRFSTGMEIRPSVATITGITEAINRNYHINEPIDDLMADLKRDKLLEIVHEADNGRDLAEQVRRSAAPPIIKMVDSIIVHGSDNRASDIHIEPQDRAVRLRIRVDGIMRETMQLPKWVQGPVVSRIKLMARMDIAERRVAQDGRIKVKIGKRNVDIRVSTLPTQYGETVVMRLLDPRDSIIGLESVGLLKGDYEKVLDIIERPQGVVLVTGPTGCGKTSSLYAMISRIRSETINIITIEDPIEYELRDVNQVAVNEKTGLTFAYTLRSVLRQDPDVIFVGEMRDTDTAVIAHQASMTGHLVFSTLHTNDAVSSVTRLRNMGIPSYMVGSALNGIIAQRLVRKICTHCKEEYTPSDAEISRAGVKWSGSQKLYRGAGCKECGGSGYSGRTGVFEVLPVTARLKSLITADAAEQEIVKAATESGMVPLREDGLKKVAAGITTLEELTRVIYLSREEGVEEHALNACPSCGKPREQGWIACPFCAHRFDPEPSHS